MTTIKKLPAIPPSSPGQGKNPTVDALREILLVWKGEAGNKLDRVVTYRDLVGAGIGQIGASGNIVPGSGGYVPPPPTYVGPLSGLTANGGFGMIFLDWEGTNQPAYSHTEIWRSADDNLSNAVLLGTSIASLYVDNNVGSGQGFFYWVRAVSSTGNPGPFNATPGVFGEAVLSPDYIIDLITGMVNEDSLALELLTPIQAIPTIQSTLSDHGIRLPTIEDYLDQLQIDVPDIQDVLDDLAGRVPPLETAVSAHLDRLNTLDSQVASYRDVPAWSNTKNYTIGMLVRYGGVTWRALQNMNAPSPTPAAGVYWRNIGNYVTYDGVIGANASAISDIDVRVTATEGGLISTATDITALETSLTTANSSISANSSAITALTSRVTTAEGEITAQASDISSLESSLTSTNTSVGANASAISALDTRVTSAEGAITAQASDITALESALSDAEDDILANATAVSALDTRVIATESSISSQASQITSLQASIDDLTIDEWASGTTYAINDMFKYLGTFYRVIATQTPPNATPPNATYYEPDPDYSSLPSAVAANASAIAALDSRVTVAEGTITSHSSSITSLTSSVSTANTNITGNTSAITALTTRVTTAEGNISSQSSSITGLTSSLATTNSNVSATSAAVTSLTTRVTAAESGISTHTTQITNLNNSLTTTNGNVSANTSAISTLDTRLDEAEGDIAAQASDITALQISVTAAHDDIGDANTAITANTSAISSLTTRVTTAEGGISTHTGQITGLTNSLTTANNSITANSNAISSLQTTTSTQGGQISSIGSRTTILEGSVSTLQGQTSAQSTTLTQLNNRVTTAEGTITSQGSSITSINSSISGLTTNVGNLNTTVSGQASALSLLSGRVTAAEGVIDVHADRIDQLEVDLDLIDMSATAAAIQQLDTRVTATEDGIEAQALSLTGLSVTVGGHTAALQDKAEVSVVTALDGTVDSILAQRTIKLDVNGRVSGVGLMNDGVTSKFIVASDAVYFIDPGASVTAFNPATNYASLSALRSTQFVFGYAMVENLRRFVINVPAYIQNGTITTAQISNATITQAQIVNLSVSEAEIADAAITSAKISNIIQSDNFQSGSQGWRINRSGHAEFNDIAVYDPDGRLAFATGLNYLVAVDDAPEPVSVTLNPDFSEQYLSGATLRPTGVQITHANDGILSQTYNDTLSPKGMYFIYNTGAGAQVAIVRKWTQVKIGHQYRIRARVRVASFLVSGATLTLRVNQKNSLPATGVDYILDTHTSANSITRDSVTVMGSTPYASEWYDFNIAYTPPAGVVAFSPVLSFQCRYTVGSTSYYTRVECELLTVASMKALVGTTYIRDAAITSAKIQDAAIQTLKLAGDAVTVMQLAEFADGSTTGGSFLVGQFIFNHGHTESVKVIIDFRATARRYYLGGSSETVAVEMVIDGQTYTSAWLNTGMWTGNMHVHTVAYCHLRKLITVPPGSHTVSCYLRGTSGVVWQGATASMIAGKR